MTEPTKKCSYCQRELPESNFQMNGPANRRRKRCDECHDMLEQRKERVRDKEEIARIRNTVDEAALKVLESLGKTEDIGACPHLSHIWEGFSRALGGTEGYVQHVMISYLLCEPGSARRQRYDLALMNLAKNVSQMGAADKPLTDLTDDELEERVENREERLRKMLKVHDDKKTA